jgi:membrane protein
MGVLERLREHLIASLVRRSTDVHAHSRAMLRRMAIAQSRLGALARAVRERYRDDEVGTHAAALAYQLFLSTLALSLVGLALIGLAEDVLPFDLPEGTEEQFANLTRGRATLGIASFVVLLWTASALARRGSTALRVVFRTGREGAVRGGLRAVATTLGLIVVIGALPVLTGVIAALRIAAGFETPFRILGLAATAVLEFGLFLLAYTVLTPGRLGWRIHLPGALVMTAGWALFTLVGALLIEYYLSRATLLYGTIGATVALLLFLRLGSDLFLIAAELSAVIRSRRRAAGSSPGEAPAG